MRMLGINRERIFFIILSMRSTSLPQKTPSKLLLIVFFRSTANKNCFIIVF